MTNQTREKREWGESAGALLQTESGGRLSERDKKGGELKLISPQSNIIGGKLSGDARVGNRRN